MTTDLRKEYTVTLGRWERQTVVVTVKAADTESATRVARKACRSIDYNGWDGWAELDTTTPPRIESEVIAIQRNGKK